MRRVALVLGTILVLFAAVLVALALFVNAGRFKPALESKLSAALGRQTRIGDLRMSILSGGVVAQNVSIADDPAFSSAPFVEAGEIKIGVELAPLVFSRKLIVTGLTIRQPHVTLISSPDGRWNYSNLGPAAASAPSAPAPETGKGGLEITARSVRIVDGRFTLAGAGGRQKPRELERVNVEVENFSPSAEFPFSFSASLAGGGDLKTSGKAGPIVSKDVVMTPVAAAIEVSRLNLGALSLAGSGLAGTGSLTADFRSSSGQVTLKGKIKAEALKIAAAGAPCRRPVELEFAVTHDLVKHTGEIQRGDIRIGRAMARLNGTYAARSGETWLRMNFASAKMPVDDLAELLPALAVSLPNGSRLEGGTASADIAIEGLAGNPSAQGSVSLDNTRLANFDLGRKMTLIQNLAGVKSGPNTDITVFGAKFKRSSLGLEVDGIRFLADGVGELNGAGTVSPADALDFKMSAVLQTTRSAALSKTAIPFFIQGTAKDPAFKPDVAGIARTQGRELLQSEAQKRLKGTAGEAASGLLDKFFGKKKK